MKKRNYLIICILSFILCLGLSVNSFCYEWENTYEELLQYYDNWIEYATTNNLSAKTFLEKQKNGVLGWSNSKKSDPNNIESNRTTNDMFLEHYQDVNIDEFMSTYYSSTAPTAAPTPAPTAAPTPANTAEPTTAPTAEPTTAPTAEPIDTTDLENALLELGYRIAENKQSIVKINETLEEGETEKLTLSEKLDLVIIGINEQIEKQDEMLDLFKEESQKSTELGLTADSINEHLDIIEILTTDSFADLIDETVSGNNLLKENQIREEEHFNTTVSGNSSINNELEKWKDDQAKQFEETKETNKGIIAVVIASLGILIGSVIGVLIAQWFKKM